MQLVDFFPLAILLVVLMVIYAFSVKYFSVKVEKSSAFAYFQQLFNIIFVALSILFILIAAPIEKDLKGQIIGLIGIVLSGAIALSSTTVLGNTLAGIVLRMTRRFKAGDFIQVNDYFGKVSARSLLNIEIQTVDRGLISLPNLFIVSNPLKIFPSTGIFTSVEVSLGYDVSRSDVEKSLLAAAQSLDLESAYVEVKKLGDFSVSYCLHALITELESYFSLKSKLHGACIDHLHNSQIEIVSPNFMNTRSIDKSPIISKTIIHDEEAVSPIDELLFEKANLADKLEILKEQKHRLEVKLKEPAIETRAKTNLEQRLASTTNNIEKLEKQINEHSE